MSEVEETLKRIQSHRGVEGVLIINNEGTTLKSTMSPEDTEQHAALISQVRGARRRPAPGVQSRGGGRAVCAPPRPRSVRLPAF
jgi:hypothetical protein